MSTQKYVELVAHFGGPTSTAKTLGVAQSTASGWTTGTHGMSIETALRAEIATNGKFLAIELNSRLAKINDAQKNKKPLNLLPGSDNDV